jgi:hypothetical protein
MKMPGTVVQAWQFCGKGGVRCLRRDIGSPDTRSTEPPYNTALAEDEHYQGLISRIQELARQRGVPLVLRFEALRYLAQQAAKRGGGKVLLDAFGIRDLGSRCIAEQVTRTVGLSLLLRPAPSSDASPRP